MFSIEKLDELLCSHSDAELLALACIMKEILMSEIKELLDPEFDTYDSVSKYLQEKAAEALESVGRNDLAKEDLMRYINMPTSLDY